MKIARLFDRYLSQKYVYLNLLILRRIICLIIMIINHWDVHSKSNVIEKSSLYPFISHACQI